MSEPLSVDRVEPLGEIGVEAFTTTREAGSFGTAGEEAVSRVMGRWQALREHLRPYARRFATAHQVHGARIVQHEDGWEGWLRVEDADGHAALRPGTAFGVTIADCVPVFVAHPEGATAILHSGWRGTAAGITEAAIALFREQGFAADALRVHLGPAICGRCYEVSPDVYAAVTGRTVNGPSRVDLRGEIASRARAAGVRHVSASDACTRCDNGRFFSHRAGDAGRQVAVMVMPA